MVVGTLRQGGGYDQGVVKGYAALTGQRNSLWVDGDGELSQRVKLFLNDCVRSVNLVPLAIKLATRNGVGREGIDRNVRIDAMLSANSPRLIKTEALRKRLRELAQPREPPLTTRAALYFKQPFPARDDFDVIARL